MNRTLDGLILFVIDAPAEAKIRSKWLERLYEAVQEDGVDYLSPVEDQCGAICGGGDLANDWADRLLPLVRKVWSSEEIRGWVKGASLCLSSLVAAERYKEHDALLSLRSFSFWPFDKFWAGALVQQGQIDEAIEFAESCRKDRPGYDDGNIVAFCEQMLLTAGRVDQAYDRYALETARATTNLATFRQIAKKYPDREPRNILLDLIALHGIKGKWFAAAKDTGCLDVALRCAGDYEAEPATLIRAARDFIDRVPASTIGPSLSDVYLSSVRIDRQVLDTRTRNRSNARATSSSSMRECDSRITRVRSPRIWSSAVSFSGSS